MLHVDLTVRYGSSHPHSGNFYTQAMELWPRSSWHPNWLPPKFCVLPLWVSVLFATSLAHPSLLPPGLLHFESKYLLFTFPFRSPRLGRTHVETEIPATSTKGQWHASTQSGLCEGMSSVHTSETTHCLHPRTMKLLLLGWSDRECVSPATLFCFPAM